MARLVKLETADVFRLVYKMAAFKIIQCVISLT